MSNELLLGCGHARDKRLGPPGSPRDWDMMVTLDHPDIEVGQDIECNLDREDWFCVARTGNGARTTFELMNLPSTRLLLDNFFDEVHAYEVLEHLGSQGDAASFFAHFGNIHRILRPGGHLCATVPSRFSPWLWGDPSHRRAITQESLVFLSQEHIAANRKAGTAMSDFSHLWQLDFKIIRSHDNQRTHEFILQAIK